MLRYDGPGDPQPLSELIARTRTTYDGPLVLGEDLMTFDIGTEVTIWSR